MGKTGLRVIGRKRRDALSPSYRTDAIEAAQRRLMGLEDFVAAGLVGVYAAMPGEIGCEKIVEACRRSGKELCLPAWCESAGEYQMARYGTETRLVEGKMRILEPADPDWITSDAIDLMVVPGLAFDSAGGRVGHGAGHYDRILAQVRNNCVKIGLCFECQVVDRVPQEDNDVAMDWIVTETRAIEQSGR